MGKGREERKKERWSLAEFRERGGEGGREKKTQEGAFEKEEVSQKEKVGKDR